MNQLPENSLRTFDVTLETLVTSYCVLAARPKVGHEKLVFSHALKRQDRSSVLLLSMTRSWI